MKLSRSAIPLVLVGLIAAAVGLWRWQSPPPTSPEPLPRRTGKPPEETRQTGKPALSELAEMPDWQELNRWQSTITRSEFLTLMQEVFTVSPKWREWFYIGEEDVLIETGVPEKRFRLRFAAPGSSVENPRDWRSAEELGPAPSDAPLEDLQVAIDPGHIGGQWAEIEERWFQIGTDTPVKEGDMTLLVANLLKPRLEELGASVDLVRESAEPVTEFRPESLMAEARQEQPDSPLQLAERLFYRTAEIRARADLVNRRLRPDIVLCIHFNAEGWGDPTNPTLVPRHHLHLLVNGAYTDEEVGLADQRFQMVRRMLEGTHDEEAAIAASVAASFVAATRLPPYLYEINSSRAVNIDGNPYVWGRNLLANRLYDRPVVFLEPYTMNSTLDYPRIQAGDYEGIRPVDGKPQPSIFREYADAIATGLANYYRDARPGG